MFGFNLFYLHKLFFLSSPCNFSFFISFTLSETPIGNFVVYSTIIYTLASSNFVLYLIFFCSITSTFVLHILLVYGQKGEIYPPNNWVTFVISVDLHL